MVVSSDGRTVPARWVTMILVPRLRTELARAGVIVELQIAVQNCPVESAVAFPRY
jgi:hypothetical protein